MSLPAYTSVDDPAQAFCHVLPGILIPFLALILAVAKKPLTGLATILGLFSAAVYLLVIIQILLHSPVDRMAVQILYAGSLYLVSVAAVVIASWRVRTPPPDAGGRLPELPGLLDRWEQGRQFGRGSGEDESRNQGIQAGPKGQPGE